jgi:inorganic pyrophosphatase/exopolyphosphatase
LNITDFKKNVYVVGHLNSDLDSICSSIAYAHFKNRIEIFKKEYNHYIPIRADYLVRPDVSKILKKLKIQIPPFLSHSNESYKDLDSFLMNLNKDNVSIKNLNLKKFYFSFLLNPFKKIFGIFNNKNIDLIFQKIIDDKQITKIITNYSFIIFSNFWIGKDFGIQKFFKTNNLDPTKKILIIIIVDDNQKTNFIRNINENYLADTLIIFSKCSSLKILYSNQNGNKNKNKNLFLSSLKYKEILIKLIRYSNYLFSYNSNEKKIESMIKIIKKNENLKSTHYWKKFKTTKIKKKFGLVLDKKFHAINFFEIENNITNKNSFILVDHNELSQSIKEISHSNIIEVIDHHQLGNPKINKPIFFYNLPVGSTCTVITNLFYQYKIKVCSYLSKVLATGIISDTLNLKGPTTTSLDIKMLDWIYRLNSIQLKNIPNIIFKKNNCVLKNKNLKETVFGDLKYYRYKKFKYAISQIEDKNFKYFIKISRKIKKIISNQIFIKNLNFFIVLVTNVFDLNSILMIEDPKKIIVFDYQKQYSFLDDKKSIFNLPNIVSRKKEIIPFLLKILDKKS